MSHVSLWFHLSQKFNISLIRLTWLWCNKSFSMHLSSLFHYSLLVHILQSFHSVLFMLCCNSLFILYFIMFFMYSSPCFGLAQILQHLGTPINAQFVRQHHVCWIVSETYLCSHHLLSCLMKQTWARWACAQWH